MAAGIVTVGYLHYRNYERQYRSEVESQLSAIADLKVSQPVQWRKERLADGGILFKNTELGNRTQPAPVILDIQLPQMDGFTVARELKRNPSLRDVSIVAETSYAMADDRERTLEAGCNGCIEKPITPTPSRTRSKST